MIVALDSNIFLSALISPKGLPSRIYDSWRDGRFVLVTCLYQMDELRSASRQPKLVELLKRDRIGRMMNTLNKAIIIDPMARVHEAADPTDSFLLNLSAAAKSDYLVTGDKRSGLLQMGKVGRTQIVTAAQSALMYCA